MNEKSAPSLSAVESANSSSVSSAAAGFRGWYMISVLTLMYVLSYIDRQSLALIVGPVKKDLGISDVQMSLLIGLSFVILYSILNIPGGYLADKYTRRSLVAGGIVVWSSMTILCGFARSYWQLFVTRTGIGVGEAVLPPSVYSMIRDTFPRQQRGRAFGIYHMGPLLGGGTALFIGGSLLALATSGRLHGVPILGSLKPWQFVIVVPGLLTLPAALLMWTVREPARTGGGIELNAPTFLDALRCLALGWRLQLPLWLASTLFDLAQGGLTGWLPTSIARAWGIPLPVIGHTLGPMQMILAPSGLLFFGYITDRLTRRGVVDSSVRVAAVCTGLAAALLASLPWIADHKTAAVVYGFVVFFYSAFAMAGGTMLAQIAPSQLMGKLAALFFLVRNLLGLAMGPFVVALLARTFFEGPLAIGRAMVLNFAVCAFAGAALFALLARRLRQGESRGVADETLAA